MDAHVSPENQKRRPVNLTIRADVMEEAKALNLNASQAAELGILEAVRRAKEKDWLKKNQPALQAHNERVAKTGPLLKPRWAKDE